MPFHRITVRGTQHAASLRGIDHTKAVSPMHLRLLIITVLFVALFFPRLTLANTPYQLTCGDDGIGANALLTTAVGFANSRPGPDTIILAPNCTYNFTRGYGPLYASALPTITEALTIIGNGSRINRQGTALFRLIESTATLTLRDLTLANGNWTSGGALQVTGGDKLRLLDVTLELNQANSGGAVWTNTPVEIEGGTFRQNSANSFAGGALYAASSVVITGTTFHINQARLAGGAIQADRDEPVTINNATFTANHVPEGSAGAISVQGPLQINRSIFRYNRASTTGSAVVAYGSSSVQRSIFEGNRTTDPGATFYLNHDGGQSRFENNLWFDNFALNGPGSALCLFCSDEAGSGRVRIEHQTMANTRPLSMTAIFANNGDVAVRNSIITSYNVGLQRNIVMPGSRLNADYNLYYANGSNEIDLTLSSDHIEGDPLFVEPALYDFRLQFESPATGGAAPSDVKFDLIGVHRPQDGLPDIGAFEFDRGEVPESELIELPCGSEADVRTEQLVEAIAEANKRPGAQTISLGVNCIYNFETTYGDEAALPTVTEYLQIIGNGATIRRDPEIDTGFRLLHVVNAPLTLFNLVLERGAAQQGGAIYASMDRRHGSRLLLNNVTLQQNKAGQGGAVFVSNGVLELQGGQIIANEASTQGGGLMVEHGYLIINGAKLHGNTAANGGGVFANNSDTSITTSDFAFNGADFGGAIGLTLQADALISNSRFYSNTGEAAGAAIYSDRLGEGRIFNNLFLDSAAPSEFTGVLHLTPIEPFAVVHNTFAGLGTIATAGLVATESITVQNNIFANHTTSISTTAGISLPAYHNLFWNSPQVGEGLVGDPRFADAPGGNYSLGSGSLAIDRGIDVGVERDFAGTRRPIGSAPDIGAYESGTGNLLPAGTADNYAAGVNSRLNIDAPGVLANDSDGDGDQLSVELASRPANGSLTLKPNGSFSYLPKRDFAGSDSFSYTISDGLGTSQAIMVTIVVGQPVEPPQPQDGWRVVLPMIVQFD
jgi:predicted outer membrane repeat protein